MKNRHYTIVLLAFAALMLPRSVSAQHTFGFSAGYGLASGRFEPKQETRGIWGAYTAGFSWRHYSKQRFVGGFGIDLEFLQQGYSFAPNASFVEDEADRKYYTRNINSIMLPIVWQPHVYMLRKRVRVYLEAAATFSYHLSSTYKNEYAKEFGSEDWEGTYHFETARDNRWSYGLAGGGGIAILIKRYELNFRVRYYFGFGDIVRNRSKYYDYATSGSENPFPLSPLRSPLDNLMISVGLNYRFNKAGFDAWKPRPKREKNKEVFKYGL